VENRDQTATEPLSYGDPIQHLKSN